MTVPVSVNNPSDQPAGRFDIVGTAGDDIINLASLDAFYAGLMSADAGLSNDTLRLSGAGQSLDLTSIPDADLQGIETIDLSGIGANLLMLNEQEVLNISPTTDTLRLHHGGDDTIKYGDGWTVEIPQVIDDQYIHVLTQNAAAIEVVNATPFRNPYQFSDANRDGSVSPLDALIIINRLNTAGSEALTTPTSVAGITEFFFFDVNGDRFVSPVDVVQVVNFLNDLASYPEGEFAYPYVGVAFIEAKCLRPAMDTSHQDENAPPRHGSVEITIRPVSASEDPQHKIPIRLKTLTSGGEEKELVGAVDAFFDELDLLTL